ncbi:MAG TPA: PIN domain-containing protein [Thermoanaerobaculia bacterium]
MDVIVDSSAWIDFLIGRPVAQVDAAIADGAVVLAPLVIAEVLSGDITLRQREMVGELLQEFPHHPTPLAHWMLVGELRRSLRVKGINVTIPDAHVAQCALDLDATLLSRDHIFALIAAHTSLRLAVLR